MTTPSEELYAKSEKARAYYAANKEKVKQRVAAYREANREAIRKQGREHYRDTKELKKERRHQYYLSIQDEKKEYKRAYYYANRETVLESVRNYRLANPDKIRNLKLKGTFGITLIQWNQMFENQGKCCAICKSSNPGGQQWHTDHCHSSGKVRGILCRMCNLMLGGARDKVEVLQGAISYLGS